jgi:hypothetical protein
MVADTTSVKQATALTPVGTEKRPMERNRIPDVPEVFLTQEAIMDIARDLRVQAATLILAAEGLEKHAGRVETEAERKNADDNDEADIKAAEQKADTAFAERFAEQQRAAQAATFAAQDAPAPEPERVTAASGAPSSTWTCPEHGDKGLKDLTSKRGRAYRACTICAKFEK